MATDFRLNYLGRNVISIAFRTAAPGVNDDAKKDYVAGITRWLDTTNGKSYVCASDAVGAASWIDEYSGAQLASNITTALATAAADATTKANAAQAAAIAASVQKATGVANTSIVIPVVGTITVVNGQITNFVGA